MTLLQPQDVPSMQGINDAITSEIAEHASTTDPDSQHYDEGWVPVALASGYESYPGRPMRVRRDGKLVVLNGSCRPAGGGIWPSGTGTLAVGEVPAGYAPTAALVGITPMGGRYDASGFARAWVDSGGGLRVTNYGTTVNNYIACNATWFID